MDLKFNEAQKASLNLSLTVSMPRWPKIYCDRHGFRADHLHTKKQFLQIVWFSDEFWEIRYLRHLGDPPGYVPPGKLRKNDLDGWMLHTGAYWI